MKTSFNFLFVSVCVTLLGLSSGCGTAPSLRSTTNPAAVGKQYKTIVYAGEQAPPVGFSRAPVPKDVAVTIKNAVRRELAQRLGYEAPAAGQSPDLLLRAGVGGRTDTYKYEASRALDAAWEQSVKKGTLVFDVFDAETGLHVWHGQLQGTVKGEATPEGLSRLDAALVELFATFPPAQP